MDTYLPFAATTITNILLLISSLFILSTLPWIAKRLQTKNTKKSLPEAGGAKPLFGHLHLFRASKPAHIVLSDMADKYGPIFTIKMGIHRTLVVSNWKIAKECFTTTDKAFCTRPKTLSSEILGYDHAMFGFSPYGPYWREIRKIATLEILSNHRLAILRHVRESEVKSVIKEVIFKSWEEKSTVDMKRWFGDVTMNIVMRMVVGKRFAGGAASEDKERWRRAIRSFAELTGAFAPSDALPFLRWLDLGGYEKSMKKAWRDMDDVLQVWLDEHKQDRCSGKREGESDFMDMMLSVLDQTEQLPSYDADTINKATCLALILGGTDTTTVTLTWAVALLLNHRDVLKKVQDELDAHVGKERLVQDSDLQNMIYLQAVMKEILRLYPAAPLSVPHEAIQDCTIGGYHVSAGTRLLVNLPRLHRDSEVWSDPCEFRPERFLSSHKDFDIRGQTYELIPFGAGRRICPGISFAVQVMQLVIANLVHGFELGTPNGEAVDMEEGIGLTNLKKSPLEVVFTPRLPAHLYG